MKINYTLITTILISLFLLPGIVLANSDDNVVELPYSSEEKFFTPFIFPFDQLSSHDRAVLMEYSTPEMLENYVLDPESMNVAYPDEEENHKISGEIFQGSITVPGPGPKGPRNLFPGFIAGPEFTTTVDSYDIPSGFTVINAFRGNMLDIVI